MLAGNNRVFGKLRMKVLHLSTYDIGEGAARGAYWLHRGLLAQDVDSQMLVARKSGNDTTVSGPGNFLQKLQIRVQGRLDRLFTARYKVDQFTLFSPSLIRTRVHPTVERYDPDIVHLHWICNGFLNPADISRIKKPIVWTMRDMWPFTGGCHYSQSCDRYNKACGACPHLNSAQGMDLSRKVWELKNNAWKNLAIHPVAISSWLADCASNSSLFAEYQTRVVPNALDDTVFKPEDKTMARKALGLPMDRKIILFGSLGATTYPRKGFEHVLGACRVLAEKGWGPSALVVVFGSGDPQEVRNLGLESRFLGRFNDDKALSQVYSAGDVMLVPSIQEAFGKTAMEAMACKTPVVCFDTTGLKDIVEHKVNGFRARCFEDRDLALGIQWVLEDEERHAELSKMCREKVLKEYTLKDHAERYMGIYREILKGE